MTIPVITTFPIDPNLIFNTDSRAQGPYVRGGSVTVGTDFPEVARNIYVTGEGTVTVILLDDSEIDFGTVSTGWLSPIGIYCKRIKSGSTATGIRWVS